MAGNNEHVYDGVVAVGLMALHDRKFFADLLENPRQAIEDAIKQGNLKATPDEVDRAVSLIAARAQNPSGTDALIMWDKWHRYGTWDLDDWSKSWVPAVRDQRPTI